MTRQQLIRHVSAAAAGTVATYLAGAGIQLENDVVTAALFGIGTAVYAIVEKQLKRFTSEEPEATLPELQDRHDTILELIGSIDARIEKLEARLPQPCEYEKAGVACTFARGHEGRHSFEVV